MAEPIEKESGQKRKKTVLGFLSKPYILFAAFMSVSFLVFAGTVYPVEKTEINTSLDFCTDYVWRGLVINDDPVLQPSATVTKTITQGGSFSLNIWGNYDLTDVLGTKNQFSEIDLIASYSLPSGPFGLEVGIIHYTFPALSDRATTEVYIHAGYELKGLPLIFSLGIYYDFDEIDGFYLSGKIVSSFALIPELSLELALSAGYGDTGYNLGYFSVSDPSPVDSLASATLTFKVSDSVSLSARGQYMSLLDRALKDAVSMSNRNKLTGCMGVKIDL